MSDRGRSRGDDSGGRVGRGSGGADDGDGEGPAEAEEEKCKGCARKGKKISFFRLRKSRKLRHQRQKQKVVCVNSGGGGGGWCCFCLKQPRTLDSPGESPSSDPNSSEFTLDMLRTLIEKNDFYSEECNPHLDADIDNMRKLNDQI